MGLAAPIAFGVRHGGRLRDPDRGHGAGPGQHLRRRGRVLPALAESVAMTHPTPKAEPAPRSDYRVFRTIGTRWMANNVHVDRATRRPVPLPEPLKAVLLALR